jgi:putative membrane protein insertion efficiency factor
MIILIRLYRFFLSPFMGNQCRFSQTCSHYSEEAYQQHGFIKGTFLMIRRILKCNPWYKGTTLDSVPKRFAYKDMFGYKNNHSYKKSQKDQ